MPATCRLRLYVRAIPRRTKDPQQFSSATMEMDYERFVRPTAGEIHAGTEEPERQPQVEEETSGGAESQP